MSRAVGDDVVAVGAKTRLTTTARKPRWSKRASRGEWPKGSITTRRWGARGRSGEDVAEGTDALVRLRGGEMRGDVASLVHPTAADDVEPAVRERARASAATGRARFGRGVPPEGRSIGENAAGRGVPPGVVRSIAERRSVRWTCSFGAYAQSVGVAWSPRSLSPDEERRVREGETPPRVARQRGGTARWMMTPKPRGTGRRRRASPGRGVRHEITHGHSGEHAHPSSAPHVRRAVAGEKNA